MRSKTLLTGLMLLALLALAALLWRSQLRRHHWESLIGEEQHRQAELRTNLDRLQDSLAEARRNQAKLAAAATTEKKPIPRRPASAPRTAVSMARVWAANPALANLWLKSRKSSLNASYGPLFRLLKLAPEQAEKLKQVMAEEINRRQDIGDTATTEGLTYTDPTVTALLKQSADQAQAEEQRLLGDAGLATLEDYNRSLGVRGMVSGLAAAVAASAPLTADQADALTQAAANESPSYRAGGNVDLVQLDWDAVDRAAEKILSPEQFDVWKNGNVQDPRAGQSRSYLQLEAIYDKAAAPQ
jgi:hypothetical protein